MQSLLEIVFTFICFYRELQTEAIATWLLTVSYVISEYRWKGTFNLIETSNKHGLKREVIFQIATYISHFSLTIFFI